MFGAYVTGLLKAAGHSYLAQAVAIILGTFILEDAATVLAAMRVQTGGVPWWVALLALYVGIVLGDLGLYGLGALASKVPYFRRWIGEERLQRGRHWLSGRVFRVVFISRFLPGMRLPTYTACGFLHASLSRFCLAAIIATLAWTSMLFLVSLRVGQFLIDHLGAWRWAGAAAFAVALVIAGRYAARLQQSDS
jgi:membrane protein DedA with SNARE-associated domain